MTVGSAPVHMQTNITFGSFYILTSDFPLLYFPGRNSVYLLEGFVCTGLHVLAVRESVLEDMIAQLSTLAPL